MSRNLEADGSAWHVFPFWDGPISARAHFSPTSTIPLECYRPMNLWCANKQRHGRFSLQAARYRRQLRFGPHLAKHKQIHTWASIARIKVQWRCAWPDVTKPKNCKLTNHTAFPHHYRQRELEPLLLYTPYVYLPTAHKHKRGCILG